MPVGERSALLHRVADRIERRFDDFVAAEIADTGKPLRRRVRWTFRVARPTSVSSLTWSRAFPQNASKHRPMMDEALSTTRSASHSA